MEERGDQAPWVAEERGKGGDQPSGPDRRGAERPSRCRHGGLVEFPETGDRGWHGGRVADAEGRG